MPKKKDENDNLFMTTLTRIRRIDLNTGLITTVAGGDVVGFSGEGTPAINALLDQPRDVTIDSLGNLFIADTLNERIRVVRGSP